MNSPQPIQPTSDQIRRFLAFLRTDVAANPQSGSWTQRLQRILRNEDNRLYYFMEHHEVAWSPALTRACAEQVGLDHEYPLRSFTDMEMMLVRHANGMVSTAECILALQCVNRQVQALVHWNGLPPEVAQTTPLSSYDQTVAADVIRDDPRYFNMDKELLL